MTTTTLPVSSPLARSRAAYKNIALWTLQGWLAMFFIAAGYAKLTESMTNLITLMGWPAVAPEKAAGLVPLFLWDEAAYLQHTEGSALRRIGDGTRQSGNVARASSQAALALHEQAQELAAAAETFVVDAEGIVRWKYTGPLTDEVVATQLMPLVEQLERTP